jgi:ELWxxDGT repeat protein
MKKLFLSIAILFFTILANCQNPQLLKDVYPGSTGSDIQEIVKTSNYTFFNAEDDDLDIDRGLYRTDGTPGGTIKLNLTYPTYISTKAEKLTALGDKVVFAGDNFANYGEIWVSDGTQGGTIAIERFQPTASGVLPVKELKTMGSNVFYSVVDGNNHAVLKKTDGTPGGTSVVYDFSAFSGIPAVLYLTAVNNILYFVVYDVGGTGVDQLWRSDGTTGGTHMLMNFGTDQYLASFLMPAGNNIYAMIVKPGTGNVLWKSDGTVAGTVSVKTIGTTGNNNYPHNAAIGSTLYFAGLDGNGKELWKTDGTEAGTIMVQNINAGAANSNPTLLTALNNNLYFYADGGVNGNELWKFDGSSASEVLDIYPGSTGSKPLSNSSFQLGFVESNGTIVFNAANDATGQELWITDGTAANTKKIKDINPFGASNPSVLTPGNPVYFSANNGVNGAEIFKYDNSDVVLGLKNVWLTGSAFGSWTEAGVIKLTNNGGGIFTATNIEIIGDGRFKFTEGTWASAVGYSATPGFPTGVTVVPGTDITGVPGFWNVTYNYITKAYSFIPTPLDNWGVVGTATPNGWIGPDMPLTYNANSNKWSAVVSLSDGEIKFRNNNNWSVNYGGNGTDGTLVSGGENNIAITAGRYLITLDFNTLNYSIKSALVTIPDPNFEQALINLGIDKDAVVNASILRSDAEAIIDLDLNNKNISSLSGIEHFTNLRYLYCNNNLLTELNLGNNPNLINLHCGENTITAIDVSKYPNLASLQIYLNKLTTLDVSNNPNLEELLCSSNKLTSMDVSGNSKLKFMNFADNKLVNLNVANGNNANFTHPGWANFSFDARYNPALMCIKVDAGIINTIPSDWFKDETASYNTDCPVINCNDLVVIPDANFEQALFDLGFDTNGLNGTIKKCDAASILDLNLNNKSISSLSGIEHFVGLRYLYCNNNSLTEISLGNKPNLINFQCSDNVITSIDLSNCPNLEEFFIRDNKLTSLDVSQNPKLKNLVCSSNKLTSIDVSSNTNLKFIDVSSNKLVNLNIANGNNPSFSPLFWTTIAMNALNNPALGCIKVDASVINSIPSNWSKDVTAIYSSFSCESLPVCYVNDNYLPTDVYTTADGDDANPGTAALPFATIQYAINRVAVGGVIYVDGGTYTEQVTITKSITINGAGKNLTSVLIPATVVTPPGSFTEKGVIQTAQNIGDIFIENMSITGGPGVTPVIIQSGGGVKNCKLQNGNQGIFIRVESAIKTAVVENNIISAEYIGINFQGSGLTASLINNTITVTNPGFSAGIFAGLDFGPLPQLTVTGNSISNYATYGFLANSLNGSITQNSIVGNGPAFSTNTILQATCNWFGTSDAEIIKSKIDGNVNYGPWLVNGTDNDPSTLGFQPVPDCCTGRQNKFYVNDNSQEGDVYTTAVGNNTNNGFSTAPYATIDYAITIAQAGDTIFVDAGTHILPNIDITKALTFLGPNYQTTPNNPTDKKQANDARNAEATVTGSTISISSNNLSFEGFTFDPGDKFAFVLSNNSATNNDFGNFFYSKNILKIRTTTNNSQFSIIGKFVTSPALPVTSGYNISDNRFEKISTATGSTLQFSYVKDITVTDNSFVASGSILRSQQTVLLGATGIIDAFIFSNNIIEDASTVIGGNRIAGALISDNKMHNINNAFSNTNSMPGSSNIEFRNNELDNDLGMPFMLFNRTGVSLAGTSNIFKVENNIFTGVSVAEVDQLFGSMNLTVSNTVLNPSFIIRGNKITYYGDFSSVGSQAIRPITVRGNIGNLTLDKNEILLNNSGSLLPFNPTVLLPDNPAITIGTDVGTFAYLKVNSTINISNNKINGFQNSIAFYDSSNGRDSYTGYGNIPEGATVNINNNSFTGDSISINNGTVGQIVNASCNWFGTANAATVSSKISEAVNYTPWLSNGTDSDLVSNGFQPLPDVCNGTPVTATLDASANITCKGANNGTINITVSNGLAPYSFLWTNNDNPEFSSSNKDMANLEPGTYQLLLTDTNSSTASLSGIVISEPDLLTASASGIENICFGASEGTAFVLADGGVPPYSYLWSNNETTDEISNLAAGTYSVTVTDANGCITIASCEVTQPTMLTATIVNNSTICSNNATVTADAGTPGYTYLWSNGDTTDSINNVPVGTYTVTVTDTNGCTTTASITLTVGEAFNPSASVTNVNCFGGSNGAITITNANGTAPFTFSQDGGAFLTGTLPYSINNLSAGTFEIAVKDSNGCTGFVTKTIVQPALLTATIITVQSTCSGQSTGAISVATAGGSGALKYSWTGIGNYTSSQKNISGLAAGSYILTVTDNNGCISILNASVPTYDAIVVSAAVTNVLCRGSLTGAIDLTVSGGSGSGFAYSWSGNTISTSEDISNLGTGTNYNVTITDIGSGCIITKSYVITQPTSNLSLTAGKTNASGCGGSLGTITATASGGTSPYEYKLDNGIYQSSGNFTLLSSGSYTVWAKDANGCTGSKVVAITDNGSDQYESNNSKSQAKLISIGTTINARIALATDTADWFKFAPTGNGNYKLTISHPMVNYTFNVYPSANNAAALVPTSSSLTSKQYALTGELTYYVQITGALSFNCYDLSILPMANPAKYASTNTKVIAVNKLSVKVYPNPHQGLFNLSIISPEDGKAQIELFSILGQLLAKKDVLIEKGQNTIVQFSDVGRGMILYHITIGSQEVNGKVFGKD